VEEKPAEERLPPSARPLKDEERARLDAAEKALAKFKVRAEEMEAEVKRLKGRSETDRRVFIVQKGELDLAKDRFRALESRFNEMVLERDDLAKQVWTLDQQMKALGPTAEPSEPKRPEEPKPAAAPVPEPPAEPAAAERVEPEAKA
jgi:chromosome segregation ATPase